jgi:hypothetical protein
MKRNRGNFIQTILVVALTWAGLFLTAPAANSAIQNGSFESGQTLWVENSSQAFLPLILETGLVSLPAHTGTWGVWLCGAVNEISSVSQQVVIPVGNPFLIYWQWIDSNAQCGRHVGEILVNGNVERNFNLCIDTATTGWVRQTLDLNQFRGQTVELEIRGNCSTFDDSKVSNLFLDDFSLQGSATIPIFLPAIFKSAVN